MTCAGLRCAWQNNPPGSCGGHIRAAGRAAPLGGPSSTYRWTQELLRRAVSVSPSAILIHAALLEFAACRRESMPLKEWNFAGTKSQRKGSPASTRKSASLLRHTRLKKQTSKKKTSSEANP
mmetsp:Transcript_12858/g.37737  ORF Transcript_12858/g.37737 Transcript_12858/m.37737 type:complete len:122 (-) Transcript_12858:662-1027(-)